MVEKIKKGYRSFKVGTTEYLYSKLRGEKNYSVWISTPRAFRKLSSHRTLSNARANALSRAKKLLKSL